jgi:SAM-dependent methyltransferase
MSAPSHDDIPGDYQFRALLKGPRVQRFWHRNKLQALRLALSSSPGVVVDVGCGSGNLLFYSGIAPALAVGLDASREAVRFCLTHRGGRRAGFAQAVGGAMPLAANVADIVILVEVLEHLLDPGKVLGEIRRVLKPGGRLFLTTPNYEWPSPWPLLEWLADRSGRFAQMGGAQHVRQFTKASVRETVQSHGLQVEALGTMYLWSPLLSLVSDEWADRAAGREIARGIRHGCLIHCVASKPAV